MGGGGLFIAPIVVAICVAVLLQCPFKFCNCLTEEKRAGCLTFIRPPDKSA